MLNFQQNEVILKNYLEILKKCRLFNGIEEKDLLKMLGCLGATIKTFDKKQTIFEEGSVANNIGIVLSGSVQVVNVDYFGNRSILSEFMPPAVFAEAFACAEVSSLPIAVVASSKQSVVMFIDCKHVLHTCTNNCGFHQALIFNLMKDIAEKTIIFHQRIEVTSKRTTREKLMTYLMQNAKKSGSNCFQIPFDRQELADYLEVDRSGLSTEISKLKKEGFISNDKKTFCLLKNF